MSLRSLVDSCSVGAPGHCLVSRIAAIAIPFALAVAACASGGPGPSSANAIPTPSSAPALATAAPATAAPASPAASSPAASTTRAATPAPAGSPGDANATKPPLGSTAPPVAIDDSLAALLPATVDGLPVTRATETETAAKGSAVLGAQASGFAAAQVISGEGSDLAIVSVIRLKPATDAAGFFRDYRPSYDTAACGPAGGVSSTEVRTIGGRTVQATLCAEGATAYHVLLDDGRIIVSVLEAGTKGYGTTLLEGLKG